MKINEFAQPVDKSLPFDVVEDAIVFMRNDPMFYRRQYYPTVTKLADMSRTGKPCDKMNVFSSMVETGLNEYCRKFKLADQADEIFNNDDREAIINKLFSEEMNLIKKGEYK
jgi:hypothetical protein